MKRRVVKIGDRRYRVELPGGDISQFSYREKPRRWDPDSCVYRDFEPDEDRYILSWEGIFMDSFRIEEDLLLFIIKFGYSIPDDELVPSEILADFNLVYEAGDWVDEWGCKDRHEVCFAMGNVVRPGDRNIRFEGYPRITPKPKAYSWDDWDRTEVVAEVKIPELDFDKLEEPRVRRRTCERTWRDRPDPQYEAFIRNKLEWLRRSRKRERLSDEECVFTLKIGEDAEKAHIARKKKVSSLQK